MNKYKIKISDNKYYIVYSESRENAVKKLRDAQVKRISDDIQSKIDAITNIVGKVMYGAFPRDHGGTFSYRVYPNEVSRTIALIKRAFPGIEIRKWSSDEIEIFKRSLNDSSISDYQPKEISHSRLDAIPLQARQELQNSKNKGATLLSIEGNIEDIINAAEPSNREELKQRGSKITNDLRRQFRITDNVDRNKIEQVIKSRQFELRRDGDKIQEYIYKGNSEDKKNAFEELAKVLPANVGLGLSGDVLSVSFRDENIRDAKLTSESILEKAKSLGGQAKQNGATGVLGISITSPQKSDEFADWLEKNNIHYNSDGRQYYVEIQDCEIEDKLIQSGSEEALQKNIATEIEAGKDPKQAAAIAYSIQRENDAKLKDGTCKVSSNDFGVATMFGPKSKEDLERLARVNEKVYLEYEVNGRNRGFWKAASSLLRQLNSGTMRIIKVYDSSIKDSISKVENIGKFTLWQDEDTKEYYFDATISRSGKKLHPLGTNDINKAREKVKKELEWITDSNIVRDGYDYIGNAMVFKSLPRIGEKAQKYGFGYSNSVISKIEKTYNKDGYQFYRVYCMDEEDYKNNHGTQYYYSVAIKDSNIVRDYSIEDAEELPHITKEQWNKIPKDYKTTDPATGKKQAFAGSLGIAPGGTTLLTEGKHFIIDADIEDVKELVRDIMKNDQIRISNYSSNGEITLDSNQLYSTDVEELARVIRQRGHKCDILNTRTVKLRDINSLKDSNTVRDSFSVGEKVRFKGDYGGSIPGKIVKKLSEAEKREKAPGHFNPNAGDYYEIETESKNLGKSRYIIWERKIERDNAVKDSAVNYNDSLFRKLDKKRTERDNDTNNTNKILDSDIVVARSLDELISKIKSWDGETTTNYILSPKSSGWYFDYFITMGHKYSYYAYIKKTAHGRHDNPNVDISKQNIDKTVTAKTAQELIDQVVIILK